MPIAIVASKRWPEVRGPCGGPEVGGPQCLGPKPQVRGAALRVANFVKAAAAWVKTAAICYDLKLR